MEYKTGNYKWALNVAELYNKRCATKAVKEGRPVPSYAMAKPVDGDGGR